MPGAVRLAALGLVVFVACLVGIMAIVVRMSGIAITEPISCILALLVLYGLFRGHRLAYLWGRRIGLAGAVLNGFVSIGHLVAASVGGQPIGATAELAAAARLFAESHFAMAGFCAVAALAQLSVFVCLGDRSARGYFGLNCPACGEESSWPSTFFGGAATCEKCGEVW